MSEIDSILKKMKQWLISGIRILRKKTVILDVRTQD